MKIVKNSEARLVIKLRLCKNSEEKLRNERMQIYSKFNFFFNARFSSIMAHHFFVKFVTLTVLVLVSTNMIFSEDFGNNLIFL